LKRQNIIIAISIILAVLAASLLTPLLKLVVYDPYKSPYNSDPYPGGSESNPTPLKIGETIQVRLNVEDRSGNGIGIVVCTILDMTGEAPYERIAILYLENMGGNTWAKEWTVPSEYTYDGKTYQLREGSKLKFAFASFDKTETYVCSGPITYAYIAGTMVTAQPEGYFKINGKEATEESIHIIFDPTVTFSFIVTEHPEYIAAVKVSVNGEVLTLDKISETKYEKAYTLPGPGKYEIEGWIVPTYDSGKQIVRMSIVTEYGGTTVNRVALALAVLLATTAAIIVIVLRRLKT